MESGRPDELDQLAERLTSRDVTRWFGYFQAIHELVRSPLDEESLPGGRRYLSEPEIEGIFRAQVRRAEAA